MMLRQFFNIAALRPATRLGQLGGPSTASTSYLVSHRQLSSSALCLNEEDTPSSSSSSGAEAAAPLPSASPAAEASTPATAPSGRAAASTNLDDILASAATSSPTPVSLPGMRDFGLPSSPSSSAPEPSLFRATTIRPRIRTSNPLLNVPAHKLHVRSSRNNTILTLTSPQGEPLAFSSGGSVGFKKAARSGYEAAYRAAFNMFAKIGERRDAWRILNLEILWNGFGQGREAVYRALLAGEGQATRQLVAKMTDKTPVKVGGVRPKKKRML